MMFGFKFGGRHNKRADPTRTPRFLVRSPDLRDLLFRAFKGAHHSEHSEQDDAHYKQLMEWAEAGPGLKYRVPEYNETLLHYAVHGKRIEAVRVLLGLGANVNERDCRDFTPLIFACDTYPINLEILSTLLAHGADPNLEDQWHRTAMWYAKGNEKSSPEAQEAIQLLSQAGFEPVPGRTAACDMCGAPVSNAMAERNVKVTFQGVFAHLDCSVCQRSIEARLEAANAKTGLRVQCPHCACQSFIPAKAWCTACNNNSLASGWQQMVVAGNAPSQQ